MSNLRRQKADHANKLPMKNYTKILIISAAVTTLFSCSSHPVETTDNVADTSITKSSVEDAEDLEMVQKNIAAVDAEIKTTDSLILDAQKRLEASKKVKGPARKGRVARAEANLSKYEEQRSKLESKKLDLESEVWLLE